MIKVNKQHSDDVGGEKVSVEPCWGKIKCSLIFATLKSENFLQIFILRFRVLCLSCRMSWWVVNNSLCLIYNRHVDFIWLHQDLTVNLPLVLECKFLHATVTFKRKSSFSQPGGSFKVRNLLNIFWRSSIKSSFVPNVRVRLIKPVERTKEQTDPPQNQRESC